MKHTSRLILITFYVSLSVLQTGGMYAAPTNADFEADSTFHYAPQAQNFAPCGVVDAFDYPIDISDTVERDFDDFGQFRARWGGLHTGIDLGFNRYGEPVRAAARGRVTLSDLEEWNTERGVVIIQHILEGGNIFYTLYGHVEATPAYRLPQVGSCVARGDVIGVIGDPDQSRPHLHYEIRDFLPNDGGPGYVVTNPIPQGWYHPLEFTAILRARLSGALAQTVSLTDVPTLAPVLMESGLLAVARDNVLNVVAGSGAVIWSIRTEAAITKVIALAGDRVVVRTERGFVFTAQNGRYLAQWQVGSGTSPVFALGDTLIFVVGRGGLQAFDPSGSALWEIPQPEDAISLVSADVNGSTVAVGSRVLDGILWRVIDALGAVELETTLRTTPTVTPNGSGWLLMSGSQVFKTEGATFTALGTVSSATGSPPGFLPSMVSDVQGNSYILMGDAERTMLSLSAEGEVRWRVNYPMVTLSPAPLLEIGGGCALYTLDPDGMLNAFNPNDGVLIAQVALYAGGERTSNPNGRLLRAFPGEGLVVSAGFLSTWVMDGRAIIGSDGAC